MLKRAFKNDTQIEKLIANLPRLSILMMLLSTHYALMHSKWNRCSNLYFVKIVASQTEIL